MTYRVSVKDIENDVDKENDEEISRRESENTLDETETSLEESLLSRDSDRKNK